MAFDRISESLADKINHSPDSRVVEPAFEHFFRSDSPEIKVGLGSECPRRASDDTVAKSMGDADSSN
jgi:hypothetical protein